MKTNLNHGILTLIPLLMLNSCAPVDEPIEENFIPVIENSSAAQNIEISLTSIKINGSISYQINHPLLAYGTCWSSNPNPDINDNYTDESTTNTNPVNNARISDNSQKVQESKISFSSNISNLIPNQTYYFRIYATTNVGTVYGEEISYNTLTLAGTTWDLTFLHSETLTWHADVTFYEDGSAFYTEPAAPGVYDYWGVWSLEENRLHYDMIQDTVGETYILTGFIEENSMNGTYTFNQENPLWTGVKY